MLFRRSSDALLQAIVAEIVSHYRWRKASQRFAPHTSDRIAASVHLRPRAADTTRGEKRGTVSCDVARTFSSRASRKCDFGASVHALVSIIFLLTSFCVDSIHSISCNR